MKNRKRFKIFFLKFKNVSDVLETGAVLATINAEFHIKYDLPKFFNWVLDITEYFFHFFMLEGSQKMLDKYDSMKKENPVENYTLIPFATSFRKY